jgi:hypothetical protein
MFHLAGAAFLALAALGLTAEGDAQAPPGPLPGTASQDASRPAQIKPSDTPRIKNLAGTWKLNRDDSDDPQKKLQQARGGGRGQGGGRSGGGMGGGGWPGGGGYGGRRMGGRESDEERQKMQIFLEPAQELTIAQKEPEIDITGDSERRFTVFTDGRKVERSKDSSKQQFDAKWEEYRLVMEGKDPRGNKYERSYEVLPGNQQLRETLFLKVGRNNSEVSIRYIYDLVPAPKKS